MIEGVNLRAKNFTDHLERAGTVRHLTVHDSPSSNGSVERANRTHLDGARAMMEEAKLPKNLWAEAINYHVWVRNRVPTRSIAETKTPYEIATGNKPDLSTVHPWGCKAWVRKLDAGKLEPRAEECRFVGVDVESKGYRIYWPGKNRVGIERDVYFNEKQALEPEEVVIEGDSEILTNLKPSHSSNDNHLPPQPNQPIQNHPDDFEHAQAPMNLPVIRQNTPEIPISAPQQRHTRRNSLDGLTQYNEDQFGRGKRQRIPKSRPDAGIADAEEADDVEEMIDVEEVLSRKGKVFDDQGGVLDDEGTLYGMNVESALALSEDEPRLHEALKGDEREAWISAIHAELSQMEKVKAWEPVIAPPDANIIPSLFVFRRKRNDTGKIVRYKARLVVKGYKQNLGSTTWKHLLQLSVLLPFEFSSLSLLRRELLSISATLKTLTSILACRTMSRSTQIFLQCTLPSANFQHILKAKRTLFADGLYPFMAQNREPMTGTPRSKDSS